ncbi:reverse transcriptase-like protein [Candidatus Saccharibacteria bacterium]|nr:reverse transcriptase-like protein [Candidatus Saccharibacteria bacterium]
MKQRIRVVGIVKDKGGGILLLKRPQSRAEEVPAWEILTGKIHFGEQPEEALARSFYEYLGVEVSSIKLRDAVTFVGLSGSSQMENLYIVFEVVLPDGVKLTPMDRYTAFKYLKKTELTTVRLEDATMSVIDIVSGHRREAINMKPTDAIDDPRGAANGATVYVDGGSRGNPGPAAIGYYIVGQDGRVIKRGGEFIGFATSRVAEYYAMKEGMEQAIELGLKRVRFVGDNLMMINQLKGVYQVKSLDLLPIYNDVQNLLKNFDAVAFSHVKRSQNMEADREAGKALEGHFNRKKMKM